MDRQGTVPGVTAIEASAWEMHTQLSHFEMFSAADHDGDDEDDDDDDGDDDDDHDHEDDDHEDDDHEDDDSKDDSRWYLCWTRIDLHHC